MQSEGSEDCFEVRHSPISGKGIFAKRLIAEGSVVLSWHPKILSKQEAAELPVDEKAHYLYPQGDNMLWMQPPERYLNHSCEPNTYVIGQSDVALKDILSNEEITSDYIDLEQESFECNCGSENCRKIAHRLT